MKQRVLMIPLPLPRRLAAEVSSAGKLFQCLVFSTELISADVSSVCPSSERRFKLKFRSDEGLTLKTSALKSLYGGQVTFSSLLIEPTFVSTPHRRNATVSLETNPLTKLFSCLTVLGIKLCWRYVLFSKGW